MGPPTRPYKELAAQQQPLLPAWLYDEGEKILLSLQRWRASYNDLGGAHAQALAPTRAASTARRVVITAPVVGGYVGDYAPSSMPTAASTAAPLAAPAMAPAAAHNPPLYRAETLCNIGALRRRCE